MYYLYIGTQWGFGERVILLMLSDGTYLLLLISSVSLFFRKRWGWWLIVIVYGKLLLSRCIAFIAELSLILSGMIADTFHLNAFIGDLFLMFMYVLILFFMLTPSMRHFFNISMTGVKLGLAIGVGSIIMYAIYFIIMIYGFSLMS